MDMYRVVVTGATSMLGAALIKECIKQNVEVLAIVRKGTSKLERLPQSGLLEVSACGMDQFACMESREKRYDVFYHFAWAGTSRENRDNPVLQEENIRCTLDAVELAARLGCRKFIGAGSQAEYGPRSGIVTADTKVSPQLAYGTAKYAAGQLSRKLCIQYGMVHIWGRIFSVYGTNDKEGTMLSYAIDRFIHGEKAYFSSAAQMWDYLYEDDAGKIFYLLGKCIEDSRVYCIADGKSRPLKEFIFEMREIFGDGAECKFASDTGGVDAGLQPDTGSLFQDISFQPEVKFREGIRKMIDSRIKMQGGGPDKSLR